MLLLMTLYSSLLLGDARLADVPLDPAASKQFYAMGTMYESQGMLAEARAAYENAFDLSGQRDLESLNKLATVNAWMRNFGTAGELFRRGLQMDESNQEMQVGLAQLQTQRGLQISGALGGTDVDFGKNAREVSVFTGYVDWLDLYAGYSSSDRVFYQRSTASLDAYMFPEHNLYIRGGYRLKRYSYPKDINPRPDLNSYDQVHALQAEIGMTYGRESNISFEVEYFRPDFFWNNSMHAQNVKVSLSARQSLLGPFYVRAFGAILRDPDPDSFVADGGTGAVNSFLYKNTGLVGGGVGYDNGRLLVDVKYVPDRDLDRSTLWSVFGRVRYGWDRIGLQYDFLHDQYEARPGRDFTSSMVNMLSVIVEPVQSIELRAGMKHLEREVSEVSPFLHLVLKTGI
jgi:tetratricopeptide (TPR) repeat protein